MRPHRLPALAVIVLLIGGAWIVDRQIDRPSPAVSDDVQTPMAARPGARSSAWFCTGATAAGDGAANGTVIIANAAAKPVTGTVTVVPSTGDPRQINLAVPASGKSVLPLIDLVNAPYASALIGLRRRAVQIETMGHR